MSATLDDITQIAHESTSTGSRAPSSHPHVSTYLPLTVPTFVGSAAHIFLLRQFFRTLPPQVKDAAKIDGRSELGILWRLVLHLCGSVERVHAPP